MDYLNQMKSWIDLSKSFFLVEADLPSSFNKVKKQIEANEVKMALLKKIFEFVSQRRNMFQENRHSEWILQKSLGLGLDPENPVQEQLLYKLLAISRGFDVLPAGTNLFQYKTPEQIEQLYEEINRKQEEEKVKEEMKKTKKSKSNTPIISMNGIDVYELFDAKIASEMARNGINEKTHWDASAGVVSSQAAGLAKGRTAITRWCTASEGTAQSYLNSGPLYIFVDEPTGVPLAQFNFETNQYMDIQDRQIIDADKLIAIREKKIKIINSILGNIEKTIRSLYFTRIKDNEGLSTIKDDFQKLDDIDTDLEKKVTIRNAEVESKIHEPMMILFRLKFVSKTENKFIERFVHAFLKQKRDPKLEQDFFQSATQGYSKDVHNFMIYYLVVFFREEGAWPEFEKYSQRILENKIKETVQEKYEKFKELCEMEKEV